MLLETSLFGISMNGFSSNQFSVDPQRCIRCGECVNDCPVNILVLGDTLPYTTEGKEGDCIGCQHCLSVCPTGAVSVLGLHPDDSVDLTEVQLPSLDQMEVMVKGRRSVRRYVDENVDSFLIRRLLDMANYAPSGRNDRQVCFSVIDNRDVMNRFREETLEGLAHLVQHNALPLGYELFADIVSGWSMYQVDVLFRWAPHLVVVSVPEGAASPEPDGLIALSQFDMAARSAGLGTLWNGLVKMAITLVPELRVVLKIPDNHLVIFAMCFGKPDISYARCPQYDAEIQIV